MNYLYYIKKTCVYVCIACFTIASVLSCATTSDRGAGASNNRAQGALDTFDDTLYDNYFVKKSYEETIAKCDKAIALNPDDANAYYFRGLTKTLREGKKDEYVDGKAMKDGWHEEAVAKSGAKGDFVKAIAKYDNAIALKANAEAYYFRGLSKSYLEKYEEAIADFDMLIALIPDDAKAYYLRGEFKGELGRYEEAIAEDFDKAIEIQPDETSYIIRAVAREKSGKHEEAEADFDKAKKINQTLAE